MIDQVPAAPPSPPLDQLRWSRLFTLLSMDVVIAFHDLMGLTLSAPETLRDVLRADIVAVRHEFAAAPPGGATYAPERTLNVVSRALGDPQHDHLVRWAQHVFGWNTQEHRGLLLWDHVLRFCAPNLERWRELGFPDRLAGLAHQELRRAIDISPHTRRHEEVYKKPLSDWDLHMYAVNLFDDDDVASRGPDSYVYATCMNAQGYRFWTWLTPQLTPQEQEALRQHALRMARREASLTHVTDLPLPRYLEIQP